MTYFRKERHRLCAAPHQRDRCQRRKSAYY
jgi:hypothetical protein